MEAAARRPARSTGVRPAAGGRQGRGVVPVAGERGEHPVAGHVPEAVPDHRRQVVVPVAGVQGGAYGLDHLVGRHEEDTEAQLRHVDLVVQLHGWRIGHDNSLAPPPVLSAGG